MSDSATPWTEACQASLSCTISGSLLNSCPLSQWCNSTISSSVVPFSSCLQSFPASGFFPIWLFTPGGQSTGASPSASVLPMNIQDWFLLGLTGLISLMSKGFSKVFGNTTVQKHQLFSTQPSCFPSGSVSKEFTCNAGDLGLIPGLGRSPGEGKGYPLQYSGMENSMDSQRVGHNWTTLTSSLLYGPTLTSIHDYWKKKHSFDYIDFVSKIMSLLFNTLSRFDIAFLPRSKHLSVI